MTSPAPALPPLDDVRIDAMEESLFAAIARDRAAGASPRADALATRRRRRAWGAGAAAAAVVLAAAVLTPNIGALLGGSAGSTADSAAEPAIGRVDSGADAGGGSVPEGATTDTGGAGSIAGEEADREVVATASAAVEVDDARAAAARIGADADELGGYVEAMSVGGASAGASLGADTMPMPPIGGDAWVTVRVPADRLGEAVGALEEAGEVTSSQVDRRDVTTEAIDLRARVAALEASVARLTELVARSASTADLIAAETALSERQSELQSYRGQLEHLDDRIAMSSLTVSLIETAPAVEADPAGFGDGVAAGWNGLVAALNGFVVALGFLLPWLAPIVVIVAVAWLSRGALRRRRRERLSPKPGGDAAG
jgi:hypothetical protein